MIAIASDHGGYDLKERVKKYLEEKNIPYQDCLLYTSDAADE